MKRLIKKEILDWHANTQRRLEARRIGAYRGWARLSVQDYENYKSQIETYFEKLKKAFNEQIKKSEPSESI